MCRVVNVFDRRLGRFPVRRFERQRLCDQRWVFGRLDRGRHLGCQRLGRRQLESRVVRHARLHIG